MRTMAVQKSANFSVISLLYQRVSDLRSVYLLWKARHPRNILLMPLYRCPNGIKYVDAEVIRLVDANSNVNLCPWSRRGL